jgi:hypothetical protein
MTDLRKTARLNAIANALYFVLFSYTLWSYLRASAALMKRLPMSAFVALVAFVTAAMLVGFGLIIAFLILLSVDTFAIKISPRMRYLALGAATVHAGDLLFYMLGATGFGIYRSQSGAILLSGALFATTQVLFLVALSGYRIADDVVPSHRTPTLKKVTLACLVISLLALTNAARQPNVWYLFWGFL